MLQRRRRKNITAMVCVMFSMTLLKDGAAVKELKIGLIIPNRGNNFGLPNNYGAIAMAIEAIEEARLLPDYSISVLWRNGCGDREGLYGGVDLYYTESVDVMLGPPCSSGTMPLARLTSMWNILHLSWLSTSPELSDKSEFTTFGRTLGSFGKMGPLILEVFNYFEWNRAVIIADIAFAPCEYAAQAVNDILLENGMTVADYRVYSEDLSDEEIEEMWTKTKLLGRIVLFCARSSRERRILLKAHDMGMTNGDYVFFLPKIFEKVDETAPWLGDDGRDEDARKAYEVALLVSFASLSNEELGDFYGEVYNKSQSNPFNVTVPDEQTDSLYAPYLHDAVYLIGLVANKTLSMDGDLRNGTLMFENTQGIRYTGKSGDVVMDDTAEREPSYWIKDLRPNGRFEIIIDVQVDAVGTRSLFKYAEPLWGGDRTDTPLDTPPCGFINELCPPDQTGENMIIIGSVVAGTLVILTAVIFALAYRRKKFEEELNRMLWKVDYREVNFKGFKKFGSLASSLTMFSHGSRPFRRSESVANSIASEQKFTTRGVYRDKLVAIKYINKDAITIDRNTLLELKVMREMTHVNTVQFAGLCPDAPNICILTHYCSRGSLQDVLENDDIKLDWLFKTSLLSDIVMGMEYIHGSEIVSHGRLKSPNCVIDSRWTLKITDYGLSSLRENQQEDAGEYAKYARMLWTAPELLRSPSPVLKGTQKGDVYSFAIILRETLTRSGPFDTSSITPQVHSVFLEIVERIKIGGSEPFRPSIVMIPSLNTEQSGISEIVEESWDEDASKRPTFKEIKAKLKQITRGKNTNIMDNILSMMEKYANNLEEIVEERTQQLLEEKRKTDRLLYSMLPKSVADQLKSGRRVDPETYDHVTIFFSDIVGFTRVCFDSTPMQVVDLLNDLYTIFDDSIVNFNVYKVETIGDAYMVVSGLPRRNGKEHAGVIANMALDLLSKVTTFKIRHLPEKQLQLRIGVHTGACAAGVVGLTMPRYCLFGDTVNMASRMESNGKALRIHVSESTSKVLQDLGGYYLALRGPIKIKFHASH
ncbi:atrial natriuretic peptide receptor 1-like [Ptychodera flava]|uniref:atrial natriuretic peptide receptor 1-like n=1 Tax=Ptychodera flava TaxID=63121 RepID=UPI00396A334E